MTIVFTLEKGEIKRELIKKFDYKSEKEWAMIIYSQFGFENYEELLAYTKEKPHWFDDFYWSIETEAFFFSYLLMKYPKYWHKEIKEIYKDVSLAISPNNDKEAWQRKQEEKKNV